MATKTRTRSIADVARSAVAHFAECLHPTAVTIFTPFPRKEPLETLDLRAATADFCRRLEPRVADGLYPHQAFLLRRYLAGKGPNFMLTTATGSGKSLCFWSWVVDRLLETADATALLCFPTQALMWGQAERLARASDEGVARPDDGVAYGGQVRAGSRRIGWTVWKGHGKGYTKDEVMLKHEGSGAFRDARIRIATLDKAHYSLIADADFTRRLSTVVIDEAHAYDGMFGANVHFFLKRLFVASELVRGERPDVFLASATLNDAQAFAASMLSLRNGNELEHVTDSVKQVIRATTPEDAVKALESPQQGGLTRVVLLLDEERASPEVETFLGDASELGTNTNAIYFSESKFYSKHLARRLRASKRHKGRQPITYDADLTPRKRREVEASFNSGAICGATLLATNALELGIDIEGLDVCVMDRLPAARQDLLQRIGRVGRRDGQPGLVILSASLSPQDRRILEKPSEAFRLDTTESLPLPTHVDMLRWRHMLAAHNEGLYRKYADGDWQRFAKVMQEHFGEDPDHPRLKERFEKAYGNVCDMEGKFWAHGGFRASASQGKVPLIELGGFERGKPFPKLIHGDRHDVAWLEDTNLFRDAHPEGIFLGHDGRRWRVAAYGGDWDVAKNAPAGTTAVLAKWLKTIGAVYVEPVKDEVATRGEWEDGHEFYQKVALPESLTRPRRGTLRYGTWDFERRWRGYRRIDLNSGDTTLVPLAEVAKRFKQAIESGESFPFLHALTYRTFGWSWDFGPLLGSPSTECGRIVEALLERFVAGRLECSAGDLTLTFTPERHVLSMFDTPPGGNGLSQAILAGGRMSEALRECAAEVVQRAKQGEEKFGRYLARLLNIDVACTSTEVRDVVDAIRERWNG